MCQTQNHGNMVIQVGALLSAVLCQSYPRIAARCADKGRARLTILRSPASQPCEIYPRSPLIGCLETPPRFPLVAGKPS